MVKKARERGKMLFCVNETNKKYSKYKIKMEIEPITKEIIKKLVTIGCSQDPKSTKGNVLLKKKKKWKMKRLKSQKKLKRNRNEKKQLKN